MKLPFGLRIADNRMVSPNQVSNGASCGCICPGCKVPLVAKQGEIQSWNFAHAAGGSCSGGVETAIHFMAKQLIEQECRLYLPERKVQRLLQGVKHPHREEYSWKKLAEIFVEYPRLASLVSVEKEKRHGDRRPDIVCQIDGKTVAVEVAFTHFCDADKIDWFVRNNLSVIEIDLQMPRDLPLDKIENVLRQRLFEPSGFSKWLHHLGDINANGLIDEQAARLAATNREFDAAFLLKAQREIAKLEAEKRKKEKDAERRSRYKEQIKVVEMCGVVISKEVVLIISRSQIRCTVEFTGDPDGNDGYGRRLINYLSRKYRGNYQERYHHWEFKPGIDNLEALYQTLVRVSKRGVELRQAENQRKEQDSLIQTAKEEAERKERRAFEMAEAEKRRRERRIVQEQEQAVRDAQEKFENERQAEKYRELRYQHRVQSQISRTLIQLREGVSLGVGFDLHLVTLKPFGSITDIDRALLAPIIAEYYGTYDASDRLWEFRRAYYNLPTIYSRLIDAIRSAWNIAP